MSYEVTPLFPTASSEGLKQRDLQMVTTLHSGVRSDFVWSLPLEVSKVRFLFVCAEWPRIKEPHKTPFKLHEFLTAVFLA